VTVLHPANPNTGRTGNVSRCDSRPVAVPLNVLDDLISVAGAAHCERPVGRPNTRCRACMVIARLPNHALDVLPVTVRHAHGVPALLLGCVCVDPACRMKERP